jgi:hypothetical protein
MAGLTRNSIEVEQVQVLEGRVTGRPFGPWETQNG